MKKLVLSVLVAGATLLVASSALAQDKQVQTTDTKEGYGYNFTDDPLSAGGFGPNDAMFFFTRASDEPVMFPIFEVSTHACSFAPVQ